MTTKSRNRFWGLGAAALAAGLVLSGCTASGGDDAADDVVTQEQIDEAMSTPTTITFWSWVPGIEREIELFEAAYPAITVEYSNVGQGLTQYQKLRTAIQAGEAPDAVQIEYQYLTSFQDVLLDLVPYGANDIAPDFVPSVWEQATKGDGVYMIPQDIGPMALLYRSDLFAQAGVTTAPTMWDEFAEAAAAVREKTGSYITNISGTGVSAGSMMGLFRAAGAQPFAYDGAETITVDLDSEVIRKVLAYWKTLMDEDLISTDADFTNDWYQGLATGKYASWIGASWSPVFLEGTAPETSGLWSVAPLPKFEASDTAIGYWGGAGDAVTKDSPNKIVAAEFVKFINHDDESATALAIEQFQFSPVTAVLENPDFIDLKSEFFGGQEVNKLYAEILTSGTSEFDYLPFMDFVNSAYNDTLGKAISEQGDLEAGLTAWQEAVVAYGEQQGFTVTQ